MERTIIQGIKRLRVLTPYDYDNMDELVQDLSNALEETSYSRVSPNKSKKGRIWKRRSKSTGNLITLGSSLPKSSAVSEDSESSLDDRIRWKMEITTNGTQPHSDSDEVLPPRQQLTTWRHCVANMVESDSVNENFLPSRPHRRKRKFKRMAVDPQPISCSEIIPSSAITCSIQKTKKVRSLRALKNKAKLLKACDADTENMCGDGFIDMEPLGLCGKRKRSMRERSIECAGYGDKHNFRMSGKFLVSSSVTTPFFCDDGCSSWHNKHQLMEYEDPEGNKTRLEGSSSSLSSSESDGGIITNDEGREADDEQSDFFHESGPAAGISGIDSWWEDEKFITVDSHEMDSKFQAILSGSFEHLSEAAKHAYHAKVSHLTARAGREIRAGRRRLGKTRPSFSIVSSVNDKISRFMQDPLQNKLCLRHLQQKEYEELHQVATLYSLDLNRDGDNTILIKTRHTTQAINIDPAVSRTFVGDIKRRRRTPPVGPVVQGFVGETSCPLPESNLGSVMLKNMGWEPGSGLGKEGQGIQVPLTVYIRSKHYGLGYGSSGQSITLTPPPPPPPSPQPNSGGDTVPEFLEITMPNSLHNNVEMFHFSETLENSENIGN